MKYWYLLILPVFFIATIISSGIALKNKGELDALKMQSQNRKFKEFVENEVKLKQAGVNKQIFSKTCQK